MKWVTREHVHVDRTACPWLIKKFIDPRAQFIFAPLEKIPAIVKREKAIPYDCPDVELGHHGGECSFDAIVKKYDIRDQAVHEMARIIRAADTDSMDQVPEAIGLEAVLVGIAHSSKDDKDAVRKARLVYDALYAHCRLKAIREEHRAELEKMDKRQTRDFLRKHLAGL